MPIKKAIDERVPRGKIIESNEVLYFLDAFVNFLKEYSSFIKRLGELEKKDPHLFTKLKEFSSPEVLESFLDDVPPDMLAPLLKIFIHIAKVSETKDVMAMPADKKIELAEEINRIVEDFLNIMKKGRAT
jgi:hypothetical protein